MDFGYLKEIYDNTTKDLFESSLSVYATVNIISEDVGNDSILSSYAEILDAREDLPLQPNLPDFLEPFYRVKVYPLEQMGLSSNSFEAKNMQVGKFQPYDFWISCLEENVRIADSTYFHYASTVELYGDVYKIKGMITEKLGNINILHIYMVKYSD